MKSNQESDKIGLLLINLGTPDAANPKALRRYLKEFLSDPRVIELPKLLRWILVNVFILPFRPQKSARAYQKIWQTQGSPLLIYSQALQQALARKLGSNYRVELGMRYGSPSLLSALRNLQSCQNIIILPLFPQYASAVSGSAIEFCLREIAGWNYIPALAIQQEFYDNPDFVAAFAQEIQHSLANASVDLLLFSFHGLPQRQLIYNENTVRGYREQCLATAAAIAKLLNLNPDQYRVSFQSRLGKAKWIQPYTDKLLPELRSQGIKKIAVVCPSFVTDCLETLEEMGIRARAQWRELGGEEFLLIPCLNTNPAWIDALVNLIKP